MTWIFIGWMLSRLFVADPFALEPVSGDWTLDGGTGVPPTKMDGGTGVPPTTLDGGTGVPPTKMDGGTGVPPTRL